MLVLDTKKKIDKILVEIGVALDLTEAQYKVIEDRYTAVGNHLKKDTSLLKPYSPSIIPQGSFLLGTMVKPILEDDELDVDIVCRLSGKKESWAQIHLKQEVKKQIEADEIYRKMLNEKEGKRCWRIDYAEDTKFHMDILPAIVGSNHYTLLEKTFSNLSAQDVSSLAIRITDNTLENYASDINTQNWLPSNPFGYAAWFNERKKTSTQKMRLMSESVKPLPKYQADKSPLQRAVQILKRHRDIMFGGYDHKPISIIITTLAAQSYNGEESVVDALISILANMASHIEYSVWSNEHNKYITRISNPVNTAENFADKWINEPIKEENFKSWLEKAQADFAVLKSGDLTEIYRALKGIIGSRAVNEAFRNADSLSLINENYLPLTFNKNLLSVSHRKQPIWPLNLKYNVEIYGNYKQSKKHKTITPNTKVPKYCDIYFVASTNVPKPYDVYWQVVNTGEEATRRGGLRGDIMHSKTAGKGGLTQKEYSEYSGTHWIQCFIVKNGVCVARSYEFLVNID